MIKIIDFFNPKKSFILALIYLYEIVVGRFSKNGSVSYPELRRLIENYNRDLRVPSVLFLGDSVLLRISNHDVNTDTLDKMLSEKLGNKIDVFTVSHTAYHMKVYKSLISALFTTKSKPSLVLLPINLRSFSPQWDFYPSWQFNLEIQVAKKYLSNPRAKIANINEITVTKPLLQLFHALPVSYPLTDYKKIGQFRKIIASDPKNEKERNFRSRQIFIYHYMHLLIASHPKLVALEDCVWMLDKMKIPVVLYVTPINWQAGERFVGKEFSEIVNLNVDMIRKRLLVYMTYSKIRFVDFKELLGSGSFFTEDNATEHLNQNGRSLLSEELKSLVLEMLKEESRCYEN